MFESNVRCRFSNETDVVNEKLFGFPLLPDDAVVTSDSVAVGFDCGSPPEPTVSDYDTDTSLITNICAGQYSPK